MTVLKLIICSWRFIFIFSESIKIKEKSTTPITADEEYAKNPEISKENIEDLRKWIVTQPHLPQNIPGKLIFWN